MIQRSKPVYLLIFFLFFSLRAFGAGPNFCADHFLPRAQFQEKVLSQHRVPGQDEVFSAQAGRRLAQSLKTLFSKESRSGQERLSTRIKALLNKHMKERSPKLLVEDYKALEYGRERIKEGVEYMFYVDQLGGDGVLKGQTFEDAIKKLDYWQEMGVDTIYPLPFLKSPGKDGGFDVSHFKEIMEEFGGMEAFAKFAKAAREKGFTLKMDLILNHVSENHRWFQAFLKGDMKYKNYFVTRETPPDIIKRFDNETGSWVRYRELDEAGELVEIDRRLIFPGIADSHYRKVTVMVDGNEKDFWVYHTFFPFQMDLNFANPEVLVEGLDILGFWANKGIDIFRLDAIPFLTKAAENHPHTHAAIEVMQEFLSQLSPKSVLMVEANQPPKQLIEYLGKSVKNRHQGFQRPLEGTSEAVMGYNFGEIPFMTSFVSGDKKYIEQTLRQLKALDVPDEAAFTTFFRVHDEFTLEMVTKQQRKIISEGLIDDSGRKGLPFREGEGEFFGVAGRGASFLDENPERIEQVYSLLLGRPGKPVIFAGDEFGQLNNLQYMIDEARSRMRFMVDNGIEIQPIKGESRRIFERMGVPLEETYQGKSYPLPIDARDANRGPLADEKFRLALEDPDSYEGQVFSKIQRMIKARNRHDVIRQGELTLVDHPNQHVLAYTLEKENEKVLVLINLGEESQTFNAKVLPGQSTDLITDTLHETGAGVKLDSFGTVWLKIK